MEGLSPAGLAHAEAEAVRVVSWRVAPYTAAFARPLDTASGRWTQRRGCYVVAEADDGTIGLGEAAPLPAWGTEDETAAFEALSRLGPLQLTADSGRSLPALAPAGLDAARWPAAHAAAEQALLDLLARRRGVSLAGLLAGAGATDSSVAVNALLGADAPERAAALAREAVAAGYRALKLKAAATRDLTLNCVAAVRAAVGRDIELRLDANGAWTEDEALATLLALAPFHLAYVEQPTPAADLEGLARVAARSPVPVAADESAHAAPLASVLESGVKVLVLKPAACGGLLAARRAIARARASGVQVVLASALDRGVATAGALHLAAACQALPAAGLATAGLFTGGPALAGLVPAHGRIALPSGPGLGFAPCDPVLLDLLARRP